MYADCSEKILKYVVDYRLNLITLYGLSDEEIDEFQSSMREAMRCIKYSKDKNALCRVVREHETEELMVLYWKS